MMGSADVMSHTVTFIGAVSVQRARHPSSVWRSTSREQLEYSNRSRANWLPEEEHAKHRDGNDGLVATCLFVFQDVWSSGVRQKVTPVAWPTCARLVFW